MAALSEAHPLAVFGVFGISSAFGLLIGCVLGTGIFGILGLALYAITVDDVTSDESRESSNDR